MVQGLARQTHGCVTTPAVSDAAVLRPTRAPGSLVGRQTSVAWQPSRSRSPASSPPRPRTDAPAADAAAARAPAPSARDRSGIRLLRAFLVQATAGPEAYADSEPVKQLLAEKLGVAGASADAVWNAAAPAWDAASAADPHAAAADLAAGLDSLLQVLTRDEAARALAAQPALVAAPLASWRAFFDAMGFSHAEQRAMIVQCPELMVQGTVANAGLVIRHLCDLGFEEDAVRHRVVAWCPQVLAMPQEEVTNLIRLWSKFQVGVDELAGM